jgi:hypothetical protein
MKTINIRVAGGHDTFTVNGNEKASATTPMSELKDDGRELFHLMYESFPGVTFDQIILMALRNEANEQGTRGTKQGDERRIALLKAAQVFSEKLSGI